MNEVSVWEQNRRRFIHQKKNRTRQDNLKEGFQRKREHGHILRPKIQFTKQFMPTRPLRRRLLQPNLLNLLRLDTPYFHHRLRNTIRKLLPRIPIRAREIDAPNPTRHAIQITTHHPARHQNVQIG